MPSIITCPHCQQQLSVDEALSHQITQQLETQLQAKYQAQLTAEKTKAVEQAKQEATQTLTTELKLLKDQMADKDKKLDEARQLELDLRKQKNLLEDERKAFEIEKQRQLDAERAKIAAAAEQKAAELHQLKLLEKDKQLQDALKANEEMRRKLQQGSQQTQGEVLELELEQLLHTEFPMDQITPIAKGVRGADVLQTVNDRQGRSCGTILWELKNAQWSDKWLDKLREDQRQSKADLAVLVTVNPPPLLKDKSFAYTKGIWVASRPVCVALAHALRLQLNQVFLTRQAAVGKNEKMEVLYQYLTGLEFKQRVEAIIEAFTSLQDDLEKEKRWFASKWSKQEKNIRKVIDHTHGMHGDLQSIIGGALPEMSHLQLSDGDQPLLTET